MIQAAAVIRTIRGCRFRYADEDQLQEGLTAALRAAGFEPEREVILSPRDRIDLLVDRVGIETKVAGRRDALRRQLERYAESDRVDVLVVVTNRVRHLRLPIEINGKLVIVVTLAAAGL